MRGGNNSFSSTLAAYFPSKVTDYFPVGRENQTWKGLEGQTQYPLHLTTGSRACARNSWTF